MTQQTPHQPQQNQPTARRLLAIDPGSRRIGIAVSDELGLFAHPRPALTASREVIAEIVELVAAEKAGEVVVGLPLTMAGGDSDETRRARAFAADLRRSLSVPVTEWDERLSTVEADRRFQSRPGRASGRRDSAAAAIVLQAVLDSRRVGPA